MTATRFGWLCDWGLPYLSGTIWNWSRLTRVMTEHLSHKRATVRAGPWPPAAPSSAPPLRWGGANHDRRNPMGNHSLFGEQRSSDGSNSRRYSEPLPRAAKPD